MAFNIKCMNSYSHISIFSILNHHRYFKRLKKTKQKSSEKKSDQKKSCRAKFQYM